MTKEAGKIIIKSTYRQNNWTKFRIWITRGEFVQFKSTIDTSRSRTRGIQFIIINFIKKVFFCFILLCFKRCSEASRFKVGSSLSFSNLEVSEIIFWIALWYSFRSKMTTPFPLSGFVITISLFFLRFRKTGCWRSIRGEIFVVVQTYFIFNCKFYNQIDGVAMGSPLAPTLANIFMGFHESKWLNEYNLSKPKF